MAEADKLNEEPLRKEYRQCLYRIATRLHEKISQKINGNFVYSPLLPAALSVRFVQLHHDAKFETDMKLFIDLIKSLSADIHHECRYTNVIFIPAKANGMRPPTHVQRELSALSHPEEIKKINFHNAKEVTEEINQFISNATQSKIENIIATDCLADSCCRTILTNAVYFRGNWQRNFNPNLTQDRNFTLPNGDVISVPMMHRVGWYNYAKLPKYSASLVQVPYSTHGSEVKNLSLIIILPDEGQSLTEIEKNLHKIPLHLDGSKICKVNLIIPRFRIETSFTATNDITKSLIIGPDGRYLTPTLLTANNVDYCMTSPCSDKTVQKCIIEVVENSGTVDCTCFEEKDVDVHNFISSDITATQQEPKETYLFEANRPFVYLIVVHRAILLSGRVCRPTFDR